MDAGGDVPRLLRSPVFAKFAFASGGTTQYVDAMLRTTFPKADRWHTLLGKPEVKPVKITVPAGLRLCSHVEEDRRFLRRRRCEFVQKELFKQLPRQDGKLIIAVTHNTTYYSDGDATECCSWGTHGVDSATGNSFVLGSYLYAAPAVVEDSDVQPLTQQLAEFINDPLHDPMAPAAAASRLRATAFPGGCVSIPFPPETRVVAAAPELPPRTSCSSPPTPTRRTTFPRRRPSSRTPAALLSLAECGSAALVYGRL